MGILKKLFQQLRPIYMDDPFFGRMEFEKVGFWATHTLFKPLGREVEVIVLAGETGPIEAQRELYRELERRYEALSEMIIGAIITEAKEEGLWKPESSRESLRKDLRVDTLVVRPQNDSNVRWEITCWVSSIGRMALLFFRNWQIERVLLEC